MSFSWAFQWYHFHLDPIWPDGTFKTMFFLFTWKILIYFSLLLDPFRFQFFASNPLSYFRFEAKRRKKTFFSLQKYKKRHLRFKYFVSLKKIPIFLHQHLTFPCRSIAQTLAKHPWLMYTLKKQVLYSCSYFCHNFFFRNADLFFMF